MPKLLARNSNWFVVNSTAEFVAALANESVAAGDSIVMRAGTYTGNFVSTVGGSVGRPVRIMPYNNEAVILDGTFTFGNSYLEIYDLEFLNSNADRAVGDVGITMNYEGCRLIGCNIHDLHNDITWMNWGVGGIEECIIKNTGYGASGGYCIYTHNDGGGQRDIKRNLFYEPVGVYTLHIYSPSNKGDDYKVEDNIFLWSASLGGKYGTNRLTFKNNWVFGDIPGSYVNLLIDWYSEVVCDDVVISGNSYWTTIFKIKDAFVTNLVEENNKVYIRLYSSLDRDGYTVTTNPETLVRIIPFTKSKRWLGSVSIYNRDDADSVDVDFSSLLTGGDYLLRNGHNTAETFEFTYSGTDVSVPMNTWTAADMVGGREPVDHFPRYGGFMIERAT